MGERHARNGGGGEWSNPEGRGQKPKERQIGLVDTRKERNRHRKQRESDRREAETRERSRQWGDERRLTY